jgi:hypothetical protein
MKDEREKKNVYIKIMYRKYYSNPFGSLYIENTFGSLKALTTDVLYAIFFPIFRKKIF